MCLFINITHIVLQYYYANVGFELYVTLKVRSKVISTQFYDYIKLQLNITIILSKIYVVYIYKRKHIRLCHTQKFRIFRRISKAVRIYAAGCLPWSPHYWVDCLYFSCSLIPEL
jgi:hypothetical protein